MHFNQTNLQATDIFNNMFSKQMNMIIVFTCKVFPFMQIYNSIMQTKILVYTTFNF